MTDAEAEPITIPDAAPDREDAPPGWLTGDAEPASAAAADRAPAETPGGNAAADVLVDLVDNVHDKIAAATQYDGWRLTEKDVSLWRKVLRYLLRSLPGKDWPIAIAVVSLLISESMKLVGYMQYKRANKIATPVKAPEAVG